MFGLWGRQVLEFFSSLSQFRNVRPCRLQGISFVSGQTQPLPPFATLRNTSVRHFMDRVRSKSLSTIQRLCIGFHRATKSFFLLKLLCVSTKNKSSTEIYSVLPILPGFTSIFQTTNDLLNDSTFFFSSVLCKFRQVLQVSLIKCGLA